MQGDAILEPGLIAAAPFLLVPALLAWRRVSALSAGLVGLGAAVIAVLLIRSPDAAAVGLIVSESLAGLWLSVDVAAFILGGLFFYCCLKAAGAALFADGETSSAEIDRKSLYTACFLVGPFAECATGFGVGVIIALPLIRAAGPRGVSAIVYSLFSQILVAWGALGVGSAVGAEFAGMTFQALAVRSAALQAPVLIGHLIVFWWLLARDGHAPNARQMAGDLFWTLLLAAGLIAANAFIAPELGGLVATAALLFIKPLRDEPGLLRRIPEILAHTWPYLALTLILVVTRTVPPVREGLTSLVVWKPFDNAGAIAPFYHPAAWLILVGLVSLAAARHAGKLRPVLAEVGRSGWRATLVTLVYIVFAALVAGGGLAGFVANAAEGLCGGAATALVPPFGALSGFLAGSNTGSNGMMMPVQAALAHAGGASVAWAAAVQYVAGSTFTMLSPVRIATACALFGLAGRERAVYARSWPFAGVSFILFALCWALTALYQTALITSHGPIRDIRWT